MTERKAIAWINISDYNEVLAGEGAPFCVVPYKDHVVAFFEDGTWDLENWSWVDDLED